MLCNTWKNNFLDLNKCKLNVPVDYLNTENWYYILLFGGSNFCGDKKFNGWCEIVNGIMIIASIIAKWCCHSNSATEVQSCTAVCIASVTIILDLLKFLYMVFIGPFDGYEVVIIIISLLFIRCTCEELEYRNVCSIIPVLLVTIITGVLETYRDVHFYTTNKSGRECFF